MYKVTEYYGDYPLNAQLFWNERFSDVLAANFVAENLFKDGRQKREGYKSIDDYYVIVETMDESGLGDLVIGWTCDGKLMGEELEKFCSKFE